MTCIGRLHPRASAVKVICGGALSLALTTGAQALTINATFGSTFTDLAAQSTVLAAAHEYELRFSDSITVNIKFNNMTTGLGQSSTWYGRVGYSDFRAALQSDRTTVDDMTGFASSVPTGSTDPVLNHSNVELTFSNARALGFTVNTSFPTFDGYEGTIGLNLSLMNFDRLSINPSKYDLKAVAQHEIDEVLGTASNIGYTDVAPIDLFRYSGPGVRNYTTAGDNAWFSIDGGATLLVQYNQVPSGDFGDFHTSSTARVQDAFGTPGATPNLDVELRMLDVVGYTPVAAVPEPASLGLMLGGLGLLAAKARRHRSGASSRRAF